MSVGIGWTVRIVEIGAWFAAAACLWLVAVNRWLIHWVDGPMKTIAMAAALPLVTGTAVYCAFGPHRALWRPAPFLLLGLLAAGEVRRAILRHRAQASPPTPIRAAPRHAWRPLTTTSLSVLRYQARLPGLGDARLRVAHLTDLHLSRRIPFEHFQAALRAAAASEPDLLLLTGDFVSRRQSLDLLEMLPIEHVQPRYGAFAVLGNHDYWTCAEEVREILEDKGIYMIAGQCRRIPLDDGAAVQVCGTDHPWGPGLDDPLRQPGPPPLVLSHTPDNIYDLAERGAAAVFSGHYHGGQLRLPGLGALVVPSRYGRRFDRGHFRVESTHLFVSSGVGADSPPLRLYCPPDVLIVDFEGGPPT